MSLVQGGTDYSTCQSNINTYTYLILKRVAEDIQNWKKWLGTTILWSTDQPKKTKKNKGYPLNLNLSIYEGTILLWFMHFFNLILYNFSNTFF